MARPNSSVGVPFVVTKFSYGWEATLLNNAAMTKLYGRDAMNFKGMSTIGAEQAITNLKTALSTPVKARAKKRRRG